MTDPNAIAAGLSESEREALLDCYESGGKLWLPFSRGVTRHFDSLGLVRSNLVWFWLSDLGEQVRQSILREQKGKI